MQVISHRNEPFDPDRHAAAAAPDSLDGLVHAEPDEWLSAYIDGEAPGHAPQMEAYLESGAGRETWDVYHFIGDVIRTPELALPVHGAFHARFVAALEREAPIVAAPRRRPASRRFMARYGFPGLAAAAAVASVTWIAQPYFGGQGAPVEFAAGMRPAADAAVAKATPARLRQVDGSLGEYLDAHRQIAGRSAIRQVSSVETAPGQR